MEQALDTKTKEENKAVIVGEASKAAIRETNMMVVN
jgi:hypothetical protein